MAYIGREPQIGNFQVCDAISVVNGQAAYTMQVSSVNVLPETANHCLVSLNGILQAPTTSYTVSGATITFASNLVTGDVINFIQILGSVLDLGVPSDSTVSTAKIVDGAVTSAKLASGTGGKVLQVVSATDSTNRSTTSTSFALNSSSLTVNITPSATSSKILVFLSCMLYIASSSGRLAIFRDAVNLADDAEDSHAVTDGNSKYYATSGMHVLDSPSSTSEITYQIRFKSNSGTSTSIVNQGAKGNITVMEIGA